MFIRLAHCPIITSPYRHIITSTHHHINKSLFTLGFLIITVSLSAQLSVNPSATATQLVAQLVGSGASVSNVTMHCPAGASAIFGGGNTTNIGTDAGILLTTGSATQAKGPNNSASAGTNTNTTINDPQLMSLEPQAVYDACILEFDFSPRCEYISFTYIFGSEEYPLSSLSNYNDAFGFFITGPNPSGGFYANTNMAVLPGSSTIVSINTVNNLINTGFYNSNTGGSTIQYDGFTDLMTAGAAVTPCQIYHLKIAIADAHNAIYDSGVFLTANGFVCDLSYNSFATDTPCATPQGTASINISGGLPPYTYLWSTGQTDAQITGLNAGIYYVTVTDGYTCTPPILDTLQINSSISAASILQVNPGCGLPNGSLTVQASGGTPPYTYSINSGTPSQTGAFTGLGTGIYLIDITDAGGCSGVVSATLTDAPPLNVIPTLIPPCPDTASGAINLQLSGGASPYNFLWSSGDTTQDIDGLNSGDYTLTITSANGCAESFSWTLNPSAVLSSVVTGESLLCYDDGSGKVVVTDLSGGTPPYQASLNGMSFIPNITSGFAFDSLQAGSYTVLLKDDNGCLNHAIVYLSEPPQVVIQTGGDKIIKLGESVQVQASVFWVPSSTVYTWTPTEGLSCNDCLNPVASPVQTTNYTLQWQDANGCNGSDSLKIEVVPARNVFIPDAFTPRNGDGINDLFTVMGGAGVRRVKSLSVFDRWGNNVWSGENFPPSSDIGWDGKLDGKSLPTGVYVYYAEVEFTDNVVVVYKGDVTLL